jgi:hypothetical protein
VLRVLEREHVEDVEAEVFGLRVGWAMTSAPSIRRITDEILRQPSDATRGGSAAYMPSFSLATMATREDLK